MPPDTMLAQAYQCFSQPWRRACRSLWHIFCSLPSVGICVEHVGYREAVTFGYGMPVL